MQMLSDHVRPLTEDERFRFRCHPGVSCFTECCRELELALSPYDVVRLARRLGIATSLFLDRYAIVEQGEGDPFPRVFLAMVDDGRASCPFVSPQGCTVYEDRPAPCRTYPLGRGASLREDGSVTVLHVLLSEPHCRGFAENEEQDVALWTADQELLPYHRMNDLLLRLLQHPRIKAGWQPSESRCRQYLATLYDLDRFRNELPAATPDREALLADDGKLLAFAVDHLIRELYGD
ncbi:MAG: YkgJ family cysteine cluster protein [Thermodesulfobacteriota bacterium]